MAATQDWPRSCTECGRIHFKNPIPVTVVLIPVDRGVLAVRRAIQPGRDKLAFPGGFVNWGESWREAGAREVEEEIGLDLNPDELELIGAESVDEGVLLLFALAQPRTGRGLNIKLDPAEVSEWVVLEKPEEMAFPTHQAELERFFQR